MSTPVQIRKESDELHRLYQRNFAGLPRITRDTKLLREIQERARALLGRAPLGVQELRETLQQRLTLYGRELTSIEKDQAQGPFVAAAARVAGDANAIFNRYRRHFGGKPRWSRDTNLLLEMLDELEAVLQSFDTVKKNWNDPTVDADRRLVQQSIETYRKELEEIEASRQGLNAEQVVSMTASSANELFGIYDRQFANLPRLSRRPGLAERLVKSLRVVEGRMAAEVAVGNKSEHLSNNLNIVRGRLQSWEHEHQEILGARASSEVHGLVVALLEEAESAWALYEQQIQGKARDSVDLTVFSGLIDRADEVVRQARDFHRAYELDTTDRLLRSSRDIRMLLIRDFEETRKVQEKRSVH